MFLSLGVVSKFMVYLLKALSEKLVMDISEVHVFEINLSINDIYINISSKQYKRKRYDR